MLKKLLAMITDKFKAAFSKIALNEAQVMKQWKISFFVFHCLIYAISVLDLFFGRMLDGFSQVPALSLGCGDHHSPNFDPFLAEKLVKMLVYWLIVIVALATISYYCAYKKRGTFLLGSKILLLLALFISIVDKLKNEATYFSNDWDFLGSPAGLVLAQIAISYLSMYYLFNCCRLYAVNKAHKNICAKIPHH